MVLGGYLFNYYAFSCVVSDFCWSYLWDISNDDQDKTKIINKLFNDSPFCIIILSGAILE